MKAQSDSIRGQVEDFVVEELRVQRERVSLNTRLLHDLGMDGDDAVELFDKFAKTFKVDVEELGIHWDDHFGPESSAPSLGVMIVISGAVLAGFVVKDFFGGLAGVSVGTVIVIAAIWIHKKWFAEESSLAPVTVGDLVEAAKAGRWSIVYRPASTGPLSL